MNDLDKAIQGLDQLQHRKVMRELAMLTRLYIRARAFKGFKRIQHELNIRRTLSRLSDGAHTVLEAALRCKS